MMLGHDRGRLFAGLSFAFLLALPHSAFSDTFILDTGERLEGSIAMSSSNSVFIARADGFVRPTIYQEIVEVIIDIDDPTLAEVRGRLLDWKDGVYTVQMGEKLLNVQDGVVLQAPGSSDLGTLPAQRPRSAPQERPGDSGRATVRPTM